MRISISWRKRQICRVWMRIHREEKKNDHIQDLQPNHLEMKKITLILWLSGLALTAQAQSKSVASLYNKYKSDKDFFHMDLAGNFLNFAEGMNLKFDETNLEALTQSVERVKLFKLPVSGSAAKADFKTLQKGLERERFEVLMEMTEKN